MKWENPIPPEMRRKFEYLLSLSGDELIVECKRLAFSLGLDSDEFRKRAEVAGIVVENITPTLDQAWRFLMPELFEYAERVNREKQKTRVSPNVLEQIVQS